MSAGMMTVLAGQVDAVVRAAGLVVVSSEAGTDFTGAATTRFTVARPENTAKTQLVEMSSGFEFGRADLLEPVKAYFVEMAKRLKNPRPDCYLSLQGFPLSFGKYAWPVHASTSGADTFIVHGEIRLEDGGESLLHAKVSASMTVTFKEIFPSVEQPFAEGFIYNAVRKTLDQAQLELVKSGNRQPVPVTTRYYSVKQQKFTFNDTSEAQRQEFLAGKVYWLSGVLGGGAPIWLLDPRDAQYLNTTLEDLKKTMEALAGEGLIRLAADTEFGTPTEALMGHASQYAQEILEALAFIRPSFNEEMRGGHTNM